MKPVEREKVFGLLKTLDQELAQEQRLRRQDSELHEEIGRQKLRYLLTNSKLPEHERERLESVPSLFADGAPYRVCVCRDCGLIEAEESEVIQLSEFEDQSVFFVRADQTEDFCSRHLARECVGVSAAYDSLQEVRKAWEEALRLRSVAFVTGKAVAAGMPKMEESEHIPEAFAEQFVQLIGTDRLESGWKQLENYYFQAKHGRLPATELMEVTESVLDGILETYRNMLASEMADYASLGQPLTYRDAQVFLDHFGRWVRKINETLAVDFGDYRNREKINMAVAYIRENYGRELNMAIVSNHISMNYSLFSVCFKQYTGMNFVNYLKELRIREAKKLLETTDEKIIDISQKVGYENEKHFMKTFKSMCGVSPSEYRKNVQMGKI